MKPFQTVSICEVCRYKRMNLDDAYAYVSKHGVRNPLFPRRPIMKRTDYDALARKEGIV